ncbi:transcription initiation protein [Nonomuraea phyllanthi]|uniref:Transcription initiation protein n=1 Tax=Nonomuraea phyllanthi TaxID=2219224 RepID=A0A5C4VJR7_9ACTN|nr:YciI family protein [Nonomuraea phyllanthi]KAB8188964.1 transcription initiation protein [Nonomuraea phyllanthi]QFY09529.1 transcription initiation protein [Nonomuraea phyllanthi]
MKYVLMIGLDESDVPEEIARDGCGGWSEEMTRRGVIKGGLALRPAREATTVRVREGEMLLTDGPFAETKDQIGGVSVIECADMSEAVEIAARHPVARYGSIEIRPLLEP